MKKILLSFIYFLAFIVEIHAQILYGTTIAGGDDGEGTIIKFIPATNNLTVAKSFGSNQTGSTVTGSLTQASDGKLYGMTSEGGNIGVGVIFSLDPASFTYTKLLDFDNSNGGNPVGSFIQASDGKLYGMTSGGGNSEVGVIFSFDPSSFTYTKLMDFTGANGAKPFGSLTQANDGLFYGMTSEGGNNNTGVIFSINPSTFTYTKLKDFDEATDNGSSTGGRPFGSLTQASNGKLYGMTVFSIFSFDPASSTYTKLMEFDGPDISNGYFFEGNLIQASDAKLYGMAMEGGSSNNGVIFSFDPASTTYTKLKDFDKVNGSNPNGSLIQATDGKLYGMTTYGGSSGVGVIFSFDLSSSIYTKLQDFDNTDGANPFFSAFIEVKGQQNPVPIVKLIVPDNNPVHTGPADIFLRAFATDANGTISHVDFYNGTTLLHTEDVAPYGFSWNDIPAGNYTLTAKATDNNGNLTTSNPINVSVINNKAPSVSIILPADNAIYGAPASVFIRATANDQDGTIQNVAFYNGTALLHTEYVAPYGFLWKDVPVGSYTLTAKAIDNSGLSATSADVHVSVITSSTPVVNITSPADNSTFTPPASIKINAAASDPAGISKVEFYNGSKLLHTEHLAPYGFLFSNVSAGKYTLTVKATNNNGVAATTVVHVTVTTKNNTIAITQDVKIPGVINQPLSFNLSPNPVHNTLNISINGKLNKPTELYVLSASGVVLKNIHSITSNQLPLDVSSLANGVYFIKIICGDKVTYKQFVKM